MREIGGNRIMISTIFILALILLLGVNSRISAGEGGMERKIYCHGVEY